MIKLRKTIFRFVLLLSVFLNIGVNAHAYYSIHQSPYELVNEMDGTERNLGTDNDLSDVDQISMPFTIGLSRESENSITPIKNCPKVSNISISFWQPPKIF